MKDDITPPCYIITTFIGLTDYKLVLVICIIQIKYQKLTKKKKNWV